MPIAQDAASSMQDDPLETTARRAIHAGDWQSARPLWENNPSGTNADWNPKVSCKYAETTEIF